MHPSDARQYPCPTMADWKVCQSTARKHGRSFFLASRLLPPARQRAVLAAYAYCRIADDIVDRTQADGMGSTLAQLQEWEAQLSWPEHPIAIAFASTRDRFDVPERAVHELFAGLRMDLTISRYGTWEELRVYCYHVAGTVGLIVAPILGCRNPNALVHAAELGIAMQLTNILRDLAEDASLGRLYLPLDELERFGLDAEAIIGGHRGPRFPEFMQFQIGRARALYASALTGVSALAPSGRFATLVASQLYAEILREIERLNYDVFTTRAYVPPSRKLKKMISAASVFAQMSLPASGSRHRVRSDGYAEPAAAIPRVYER
jgi:15-cis-phytoene synthase